MADCGGRGIGDFFDGLINQLFEFIIKARIGARDALPNISWRVLFGLRVIQDAPAKVTEFDSYSMQNTST